LLIGFMDKVTGVFAFEINETTSLIN